MRLALALAALALGLALAPGAACQERADEAALAFLAGLEDVEEGLLGEQRLMMIFGERRIGEARLTLARDEVDGRPVYRVALVAEMAIEGGPSTSIRAASILACDLRVLESRSDEIERTGDEERTESTRIGPVGGRLEFVEERTGHEAKTWRLDRPAGLLAGGGEPVLLGLLARRAVTEGAMTFVGHRRGRIVAIEIGALGRERTLVGAGEIETFGYSVGRTEIDDAGGSSRRETTYRLDGDGRIVLWQVGGAPIRFEPWVEPPARPAVDVVSEAVRAMAGGDARALEALLDPDAVWRFFSTGPGAAELAGKSAEQIAALREGLPARVAAGALAGFDEEGRRSVAFLAAAESWEALEPDADGVVVVRLIEAIRSRSDALEAFRFEVRAAADGRWSIVRLPGM